MFTNVTNSWVKEVIDEWYTENLVNYANYLEDTIWCNERKFYSGSLAGKDVDAETSYSYFETYNRVRAGQPSLECSSTNDSFTVSRTNGNGSLTYPIAMLTSDEAMLAGGSYSANRNYYLYTGQNWHLISPYHFSNQATNNYRVSTSGSLTGGNSRIGVRPSISLAPGIIAINGDGSSESPYEVAMQ